jgi:hypothetical protein
MYVTDHIKSFILMFIVEIKFIAPNIEKKTQM